MFTEKTTLKQIRLKTGLSVEEIAPMFYYTPENWKKLEAGRLFVKEQHLHLIYDLCELKGLFKDEEKTPVPNVKDKGLAKIIVRLSELAPNFYPAFEADDYVECRKILDVQLNRKRISDDEYKQLFDYINYLDV